MGIGRLCITPNASLSFLWFWHKTNELSRAIRIGLFILACIKTHKRNRDRQVKEILEALRQNGIYANAGNAKLIAQNALSNQPYPLAYQMQQIPLQELLGDPGPSQELPNIPAYVPEVAGDRPLPAEMAADRV